MKRARTLQLSCEEPFRLFFPTGLVLGMVGVSLWPVYYAGWFAAYPGTSHARLMIQGFMASFIIGFLGTAGPRITSTRKLSRIELLALLTLDLLAAGLHVGGADRAGDVIFALCLLVFLVALGRRFLQREDSPPPNFALVALGLLNGLVGSTLLALFEHAACSVPYRIGAVLLEQGFVLLPILGVAPFLLPRLLDVARADDLPESRALFAAAIGLTIDATFIAEAFGENAIAPWLLLAAIVSYLAVRMPRGGYSFLGGWLRVGMVTVVVGFIVEAIWPMHRLGALHIVFISGFSLIVLTIAIRVIFGHTGNEHLFRKPLPFFVMVASLIFLAAIPDFMPSMTMPFSARDPKEIAPLRLGDAIAFRLDVTAKDFSIANVKKIDPSEVHLPKAATTASPAAAMEGQLKLKEGDTLPAFALTSEAGENITNETLRGHPTVMTFIFTRCPIPNFCPRMARNFAELQSAIKTSDASIAKTRVLSITIDPQYDSPAILKEYGLQEGADPKIWSFATGDSASIDDLSRSFAVYRQNEGGTISHGLTTALVDGDGKIAKLWRGNGWKIDEVVTALEAGKSSH